MTKFSNISSIQHNSPPDAVESKSIETPLQTVPIPFLAFTEVIAAMPNFKSRDDSAAQSETTQTPEPKGNDIFLGTMDARMLTHQKELAHKLELKTRNQLPVPQSHFEIWI
ncbi:hypothetical protein DID88_000018 [Monilinia fructigena]|uniref:Uncharacterized protein n=1 Tax=Monilinia fructigena TaxID=38457 RepID=A0A395IL38_9HELO|nr:hypothetical protein DID88_000018 [Monilinia fructigena]